LSVRRVLENLIMWFEIKTANYLREWQICSFAVQAIILFIGFAYYFKKGIGFPENLNLRSFYYRLAIFFAFLGASIFIYLTGTYWASSYEVLYLLKTFAIGIALIGMTLLFRNLENLKIINTNQIIPRCSVAITIIVFILILAPPNVFTPIIALIDWLIIPLSLFFYISLREEGRVRSQSLFLTFGFALFFGGLMVIPTIIDTLIPNIRFLPNSIFYFYYNYVSMLMVYCGLIMMLVFGRINYFIEIKWGEKISSILILRKTGELVLHKIMKKSEEDLIKLTEKQDLLKKFAKSLNESDIPKKIFERNGLTLIFDEGIHILALLIVDEQRSFFKTKLKEFIRDFELLYADFMENWEENLDVFESSYSLIDQHFQTGGG